MTDYQSHTDVSDETVLDRYRQIRLDSDNKAFYKGLLAHQVLMGRCSRCGRWHTPLSSICPDCLSTDVVPTPVSGRGIVYLLTLLHQGPPQPDISYATPYPLAAVEFEEQPGLRLAATLVNCPLEAMRIGLDVELFWIEREGAPWPAFQPVGATTNEAEQR